MTGTMYISLTDPDRKEVLGKKEGCRRVTVRFYYPSAEGGSFPESSCLTDTKRKWLGRKKDFALYEKRIALYENAKMKDGIR
ncbi:MAG: hypothetical protein K6G61_01005 [Solobacterium sp.]|nr:hypothetical protein [Solobacterium sp.]